MKYLLTFLLFFALLQKITGQEKKTHTIKEDTIVFLQKLVDSSFIRNFNGDYKNALKSNLELLKLATSSKDTFYLHKAYSLLGYNYFSQRDTIKAKESFEKSIEYARLSNNETALASSYLDLANIYLSNNKDRNKINKYYDEAIAIFSKLSDSTNLAAAHYYSIVDAMNSKELDRAYNHITQIKKFIPHISSDNFCEISVNSQIASYYEQKGQFKIADTYYHHVIEESKNLGFDQELEVTFKKYSESLYDQGRINEAYKARKNYEYYFKLNEEKRRSQEITATVAKFELEQYKNEAAEADKEKAYLSQIAKSKTSSNRLLTVLFIALTLLSIFLLNVVRKKRKLVFKLEDQNTKYLSAKKEAESLAKSKSKFLSTVSHELRTPLYGVIGLSSILLDDKTIKNNHQEDLKSLKFSADYLLALINDVLQINKIDSSLEDVENDKTTFCIRHLIETMVSSFEYKRKENQNNIHIEVHEGTPDLIGGNNVKLSQILMNLLGNACKFTHNGDIYIKLLPKKVKEKSLEIEFSIRDTGTGIAKDKQESIFDEFSQITDSDPSRQGSGLGLSIVKKLLAQYNQKIHIESTLGQGSIFSFTLPFDLIEQKITGNFDLPTTFIDTLQLHSRRILIVDDNKINRIVTQKILEKVNVICEQASSADEAINLAKNNQYDIILMDVNMPEKDGLQATKEIRVFNKNIPIIALTAVEIEDMKDKIKNSGMNDIIVKPYNTQEFHSVLIHNLKSSSISLSA